MGKFDGTLFAVDLDGSLLDDEEKRISPLNREAILSYKAEGGIPLVCSGRAVQSVRKVINTKEDLELFHPDMILLDGSVIYDLSQDRCSYREEMPFHESMEILRYAEQKYPDLGLYATHVEAFHIFRKRKPLNHRSNGSGGPGIYEMGSLDEEYPGFVRISFAGPEEQLQELISYVNKTYPGLFNPMIASPEFCETVSAKADKSIAVRKIAKQLGIRKVFALGDSHNDVRMLEEADVSFAPANAKEDARKAASYTVSSCNDSAFAEAWRILNGLSF